MTDSEKKQDMRPLMAKINSDPAMKQQTHRNGAATPDNMIRDVERAGAWIADFVEGMMNEVFGIKMPKHGRKRKRGGFI